MRNLLPSNRSLPVLVACALLAPALLDSNLSHADTCRPWHIDVSGQFSDAIYDENGNLIYQTATASGIATHIGAFSAVGANYFSVPENGLLTIDGDAVFTAANGEQIYVNFDGTVLDLATGAGAGTYVVTGGTGRFEGATGSAAFSAGALAPNGISVVADGALCY